MNSATGLAETRAFCLTGRQHGWRPKYHRKVGMTGSRVRAHAEARPEPDETEALALPLQGDDEGVEDAADDAAVELPQARQRRLRLVQARLREPCHLLRRPECRELTFG